MLLSTILVLFCLVRDRTRHLLKYLAIPFLAVSLLGLTAAQGAAPPDLIPIPMTAEGDPDPFLKDKAWHRWTAKNFTVLSLDKAQGAYLAENLESIKKWTFTRWGFSDMDFSTECRVLCVQDKETMKKLFRVDGSRVESRKENERLKLHVIWLVFDKKPTECIPSAMTMICLTELEAKYNITIPFWARRGMAVLNLSMPQIKGVLQHVQQAVTKKERMYFSSSMFSMTRDQFLQVDGGTQKIFDAEATVLCLMIRKELGQRNFLKFISVPNTEQNLEKVLGFKSFGEFDKAFKRYLYYLPQDVVAGKTPQWYLEIEPVQ
jgi:hypothetical protein